MVLLVAGFAGGGTPGLRSAMHEIFLSYREISSDRSGMALREIFYITQLSYFFSYKMYQNNTKCYF